MSTSKPSNKTKKTQRTVPRIVTQRNQRPMAPYPQNPITPPAYRPIAEQPMYSPHLFHHGSMGGQYNFSNQGHIDPQTFYLSQAQAQHNSIDDFEPFLHVQETQDESSDETIPDDVEVVPESDNEPEPEIQPQPQPQPKPSQRRANLAWSIPEEQLLARTWVTVSEDPIVGNDQKSDTFWRKITKAFLHHMNKGPDYRTKDQLYTKWRNMNKLVMEFNAYHMNAVRDWPSGAGNDDMLASIQNAFREETKKVFKFTHVWLIVKDCKKWCDINTSDSHTSASKRTKTSSSTYSVSSENPGDFDLNNNPASSRPTGRDAMKRKMKGVATDSGASQEEGRASDTVREISKDIRNYLSFASEADTRKERRNALKFLATDESKFEGDDLELILHEKAEIRKKYGLRS